MLCVDNFVLLLRYLLTMLAWCCMVSSAGGTAIQCYGVAWRFFASGIATQYCGVTWCLLPSCLLSLPDHLRRHLASGSGDTTVRFWDIFTETPHFTCKGHSHWILYMAWSPDGKKVASGCKNSEVLFCIVLCRIHCTILWCWVCLPQVVLLSVVISDGNLQEVNIDH